MELARPLAADAAEKTLGADSACVLQRKLTVEQAAKRSALWPEQVEWLERGRLYRFPGYEAAVMALLATRPRSGSTTARRADLSGMPVEPPAPRCVRRVGSRRAPRAVLVAVASLALALAVGREAPAAAERRGRVG